MVNILDTTGKNSIGEKFRKISDELGQLKMNTIASVHIDSKGALVATQSPGLTALQSRIAEKEKELERIIEIANEIGAELDKQHVPTVAALQEAKAENQNILNSGPFRAWDLFNQTRGEGGIGERMRVYWLPSDIAAEPSYKAEEDKLRAQIETAKAAIVPISEALVHIAELEGEAAAL